MRGRVWWSTIGLVVFIACGGASLRRNSGGDDGSSDGGTSGSSPSVGTGGTSRGGANSTGGRGGTPMTGGRGGTPMTGGRGGTPMTGGRGGSIAQGGVGNTAGQAGEPGAAGAAACDFAGGNNCSFSETCKVLGCGTAWSAYDTSLCARDDNCASSGLCEAGKRCVVAPVAGAFTDVCVGEVDSCEMTSAGCECFPYEECFPRANCLPVDEFPPEDDCPIENLDCAELGQAASTLQAYIDGDAFLEPYEAPGNLAASLESCAEAVALRLESCQ